MYSTIALPFIPNTNSQKWGENSLLNTIYSHLVFAHSSHTLHMCKTVHAVGARTLLIPSVWVCKRERQSRGEREIQEAPTINQSWEVAKEPLHHPAIGRRLVALDSSFQGLLPFFGPLAQLPGSDSCGWGSVGIPIIFSPSYWKVGLLFSLLVSFFFGLYMKMKSIVAAFSFDQLGK